MNKNKSYVKVLALSALLFCWHFQGHSQWQNKSAGIFGGRIKCLSQLGSTFMAGTETGGIFLSQNSGNSWITANGGFTDPLPAVEEFATDGSKIYAAAVGVNGGVYASVNNGASWYFTGTGLPSSNIVSIAVSGNIVLVGSLLQGVFISSDSGNTWTSSNTGLTNLTINALTSLNGRLFAGTNGGGCFFSSNNGNSWSPVNNGLADSIILNLVVSGNSIVAGTKNGGVFHTTNLGASWSAINNGISNLGIYSLSCDGNNLFAGTFDGVYFSSNNGQTWSNSGYQFGHQRVSALMCHNNSVYAGTNGGGIYLSSNYGQNWLVTNYGLNNVWLSSIAYDGTNLYASTIGSGIFKSGDNGDTWIPVNNGLDYLWVQTVKASSSMIFAGTSGGGIFASSNAGLSWYSCNNGLGSAGIFVNNIVIDGGTVFAKTNNGLFKSTNNGASWTYVGFAANQIRDVLVYDSNIVMAAPSIFFYSPDYGNTWNINSPSIPGYAYDPKVLLRHDSIFFVAISGGIGIYKSLDMGITWIDVNNGFTNQSFSAFAILDSNIFAGSEYNYGVILSTDDGANWTQINSGLTDLEMISSLLVTHQHLFAAMDNRVYRYLLDEIVSVKGRCKPNNILLSPNPCSTYIRLQSEFPVGSQYKIINQLGVIVKAGVLDRPVNQTIDVSGLSKGLFFLTVNTNEGNYSQKFVRID